MITGFNTDVKFEGNLYHVQTEARGRENPVLESLVYIGGTIVAKKMTHYADQLKEGATEDAIALLLRRQHQVVIAAIRAGRIDDLIKHSTGERAKQKPEDKIERVGGKASASKPEKPKPAPKPAVKAEPQPPAVVSVSTASASPPSKPLKSADAAQPTASSQVKGGAAVPSISGTTGGLNLDEVISDYVKRTSEQGRLDLKVIAPHAFIAGKSIGLRVQVWHEGAEETGAIVTIKVIGTAFKPQVYLGRTGSDGIVTFNLVLPAFSAGTAAIVIEAQSSHGRGELKHLIRRQ